MAGIRFKIRTILASISDDFNRANGALSGNTPVGAKAWQLLGATTTVVGIVSNVLKATSGTGNKLAVVDTGSVDNTMIFRLAATQAPTALAAAVFRVQDESNYWYIQLRSDATTPQYCLTKRVAGVGQVATMLTGVAPVAGDLVRLDVTGTAVTLTVNGTQIGTGTAAGYETSTRVGFSLNGTDLTTAVDDLVIYNR